MDYMYGLPFIKHGNDCVFVVIDKISKMAILTAYKKSIIVKATTKLFLKHVFVHFGIPNIIRSNQDSGFLSVFWSSLWSLLNNNLKKSTAFHPQVDGQTKVVNRMIMHILCMYNSKHPHMGWESPLCSTQLQHISPQFNWRQPLSGGLLGFQPLSPIDVTLPFTTT